MPGPDTILRAVWVFMLFALEIFLEASWQPPPRFHTAIVAGKWWFIVSAGVIFLSMGVIGVTVFPLALGLTSSLTVGFVVLGSLLLLQGLWMLWWATKHPPEAAPSERHGSQSSSTASSLPSSGRDGRQPSQPPAGTSAAKKIKKLRRWSESHLSPPSSSILRGLSSRRRSFLIITQIALTFVIASINWVLLGWWAAVSVVGPFSGTYFVTTAFYYTWIPVFFLPVILSIVATTSLPEKVIIAPTDVNVTTFGLALLFLSWELPTYVTPYFFQLVMVGAYLAIAALVQNGIVVRIVGIRGSADALTVRQYSSSANVVALTDLIRADVVWKALGLSGERDVDGATIFRGSEGHFEFQIGISSYAKTGDEGQALDLSLVSVVGYERDQLELRKTPASESWLKARCASFVAVMNDAGIPIVGGKVVVEPIQRAGEAGAVRVVPRAILEEVLRPTRNLADRLMLQGEGALQSVVILIVTLAATSYFYFTGFLSLEFAFEIFIVVVATQMGRIWVKGKRSS